MTWKSVEYKLGDRFELIKQFQLTSHNKLGTVYQHHDVWYGWRHTKDQCSAAKFHRSQLFLILRYSHPGGAQCGKALKLPAYLHSSSAEYGAKYLHSCKARGFIKQCVFWEFYSNIP